MVLATQPILQHQHLILSVDCHAVRRKNWRSVRKRPSDNKATTRRTLPSGCTRLHQTRASREASPTQRWWWGDGGRWSSNESCSRYEQVTVVQTLVCTFIRKTWFYVLFGILDGLFCNAYLYIMSGIARRPGWWKWSTK